MNATRLLATIALTLAFTACGGGAGGGADYTAEFIKACTEKMSLDRPVCECMAKKAKEKLPSDGVAFMVASMNEDIEKLKELGGKLQIGEKMAATSFLGLGAPECLGATDEN